MIEEKQHTPDFLSRQFALIAGIVSRATGHPLTFMLSCAVIVVWTIGGSAPDRS